VCRDSSTSRASASRSVKHPGRDGDAHGVSCSRAMAPVRRTPPSKMDSFYTVTVCTRKLLPHITEHPASGQSSLKRLPGVFDADA
jgi:hypothetical protein